MVTAASEQRLVEAGIGFDGVEREGRYQGEKLNWEGEKMREEKYERNKIEWKLVAFTDTTFPDADAGDWIQSWPSIRQAAEQSQKPRKRTWEDD